jgi:hypothetical protein
LKDYDAKLEAARQRLPLKLLMEQRGRTPLNGNWRNFARCPYCEGKDCAGLFEGNRGDLFKCHRPSCPSGTASEKSAWDEIGFLAHELVLSRQEALVTWFKQAGVWQEREPREPKSMADQSAGSQCSPPETEFQDLAIPHASTPTDESGVSETAITESASSLPVLPPPPNGATLRATEATPRLTKEEALEKIKSLLRMKPGGMPAEENTAPSLAAELARDYGIDLASVDLEAEEETAESQRSPDPLKVVVAIRYFWERIPFLEEDAEKLWKERGLTRRTCMVTGLRSSPCSNEKILLEMRENFPINVLLDACLWVKSENPGAEPQPNKQFFGWGVVGKSKNEDGEEEWQWGWTHPILIAYLNAGGEVIDLRPHKRTQRGQAPRLFVPRPLKKHQREFADKMDPQFSVFVEGEFKALALLQTLRDTAAIAALPGITMSKPLWGDILDLVEGMGQQRQVVVVFDNEDKSTRGTPRFQE